MMKFFINMEINISSLKIETIILGVCDKACPKYPNKNFAYLCNISRKMWGMKLNFFPADKDESFLQVHCITLGLRSQTCPKHPKFAYLCNISRKT